MKMVLNTNLFLHKVIGARLESRLVILGFPGMA